MSSPRDSAQVSFLAPRLFWQYCTCAAKALGRFDEGTEPEAVSKAEALVSKRGCKLQNEPMWPFSKRRRLRFWIRLRLAWTRPVVLTICKCFTYTRSRSQTRERSLKQNPKLKLWFRKGHMNRVQSFWSRRVFYTHISSPVIHLAISAIIC